MEYYWELTGNSEMKSYGKVRIHGEDQHQILFMLAAIMNKLGSLKTYI